MTENKNKSIPIRVIKRLPIYHRYLDTLELNGIERISSRELAGKLGLTSSQIRQDLSHFGTFGQRGYGYDVSNLKNAIGKILGLDNKFSIVLVGAGNLGKAIANYPGFKKRGFYLKGVFDVNLELIGTDIDGLTVLHIDFLTDLLAKQNIDIGVIATPPEVAADLARVLIKGGVKGIWNFAPVNLNLGKGAIVENVHISESLLTLSFRIKEQYLNN